MLHTFGSRKIVCRIGKVMNCPTVPGNRKLARKVRGTLHLYFPWPNSTFGSRKMVRCIEKIRNCPTNPSNRELANKVRGTVHLCIFPWPFFNEIFETNSGILGFIPGCSSSSGRQVAAAESRLGYLQTVCLFQATSGFWPALLLRDNRRVESGSGHL